MHHPCRRLHEIASRPSATNFVTCSKCLTDMRSGRNTQNTKQPELRFLALPIGHRGYLAAPTSGKCQRPFETVQPHVQE
jgi:hypothetical protein